MTDDLNESQLEIVRRQEGMVVVDAGPGTGKTKTVVHRYLELISREDVSPGDVLMLTFTNNAAAEMRQRVKEEVEERISKGTADEGLMRKVGLTRASTFDSFCYSVVMDSPEQAGGLFGIPERLTRGAAIVENETLNRQWFETFFDDFLSRRGEDYGDWAVLGSQRPRDVLNLINRLMSRGIYPLRHGWFGLDAESQLLGCTGDVLDRLRRMNDRGSKKVSEASLVLRKMEPGQSSLDPEAVGEEVPDGMLVEAATEDRTELLRFIHDVYLDYIRRSMDADRLTFGINSMLAFGLLYNEDEVRARNSYRYVIVDEFQDTNASQLMIALMILREPNLCAVGDWKQGIYSFRFVSIDNIVDFDDRARALWEQLNSDKRRVPFEIPEATRLSLRNNYRSSQLVVDAAFRSLEIAGTKDEEVDLEALARTVTPIVCTGEMAGEDTGIRYVRCSGRDREAAEVVRAVRDYLGSGDYNIFDDGERRRPRFGDIAVLCRQLRSCREVMDALSGAGIPAYMQGDVEIMSTREGKLLLAWLRFINNTLDPWGYVPIMADMGYGLPEIRRVRDEGDLPRELRDRRADLYARRRRVADVISSVFALYGLDNDITQAITSTLASAHRGSLLTISDLIRIIEEDIGSATKYPVENSIETDAVRIMTMHKAKGLEFPIVILPFLDSGLMPSTRSDRDVFLFDETLGVRCTKEVHDFGGYRKIVDNWRTVLAKRSLERGYDEERRLMFVAMSRAHQYETLICGNRPSRFILGLKGETEWSAIPDAEIPGSGGPERLTEPPDVSGYRARRRMVGVHTLMDFGPGTRSDDEADEVPGRGMDYGSEVHQAAQALIEGCAYRGGYPELGMVREVEARTRTAPFRYAEVDCVLPVDGTDVVLKGRIDLLALYDDRVEVHDWKTDASRRFEPEYRFQLSVYARAAMGYYGVPARCFIDYVSLGEAEEFEPMTMEEIGAWVRARTDVRRRTLFDNLKIGSRRTVVMEGLTSEEVRERISQGLANDAEVRSSRTYTDIFVKNAFTPFNIILFILGILLVICDELISALSATGIIIVNILISTVQEMRAKRKLDRISLLVRPKVSVIRDGREVEIDQAAIVMDDLVVMRAGEQALVDGVMLRCRSVEMDESLLTGESSTVRKHEGDPVYSGSVCVTGEAHYRVTAVGTDNYASQMLSSARKFTSKKTPLQMETGTITKVLMAIAGILFICTIIKSIFITHVELGKTLEVFVLCLDVVPIALFLLITLTYMIAAARMADSGVLLQRANSVESLSHVDTVCMDKTGTITTNRLAFVSSRDFMPSEVVARYASAFATLTGSRNRTIDAIGEHYGVSDAELVEEIQFSSERKYSAVRARDSDGTFTMYVGAWTALRDRCVTDLDLEAMISEESSKGLRTVLLCLAEDGPLEGPDGEPILREMRPVSIVSIRDEVRPDCRETIEVFLNNGMDLKVISGDDPATVDALFSIADIPGERRIVSGPELDAMDRETFERTVLEANIFGRMRPENKEAVIDALKRNGRYVAMIGDGVNDVKSLKTAQVGVALESGSGAARGVADMVLVDDNFSALPKALVEGRRTVSGMRDILKIYLTRNFALAILFVVLFLFVGYIPMTPIQNTYYAFVSVTIMAFFMTLFAKPDENRELILPDVLRFCIPSAIMISAFGLLVYWIAWTCTADGTLVIDFDGLAALVGVGSGDELIEDLSWNESPVEEIVARSAMLFFISTAGILQMLLISPRFRFLSPDGRVNRSPVPIVLVAFVFLVIYVMYAYVPSIAVNLVGMVIFPAEWFAVLIGIVAVWFVCELLVLRRNAFRKTVERFETFYMRKLQEEYTEGDVVDE